VRHTICVAKASLVWVIFSAAASVSAQTVLVQSGASEMAAGGGVGSSSPPAILDPAIYYFTAPRCNLPGVPNETSPAKIARAATYLTNPRDLFVFNPPRAAGECNPFQLQSTISADPTHVFWFDNQSVFGSQLVKLPRSANPGDAPTFLRNFFAPPLGSQPNEIVQGSTRIYMIVHEPSQDVLADIDKDAIGGMATLVAGRPVNSMSRLQFDGRWVWWLEGSTLRRYDTQAGGVQTIDTNVRAFLSEGDQSLCSPLGCLNSNQVYVAKGNQLLLIDSFSLGSPPFVVYTAPGSRPSAFVKEIIRDQDDLFFVEVNAPFISVEARIFRWPFGGAAQLIHGPIGGLTAPQHLSTDNVNLVWHDFATERISSIKNNTPAAFLLQATGLEVTQGIQNLSHDVRLIENKRTFVRFYVTSGDSRTVRGVTASLSGFTQTAGSLGTLEPINAGGKLIDVSPGPGRDRLVRSFQFELPLRWTLNGPLNLSATVNSNGKIFENDPTDNVAAVGPLPFSPSPRTHIYYMNVAYTLDGTRYEPLADDVAASQRFLRRLYPHGAPEAPIGGGFGSGLHIHQGTIFFAGLEDHVKQTHTDCVKRYATKASDRNLCASDVVHAYIAQERGTKGFIPSHWRTYGNIAQAPAPAGSSYFTRGYGGGFASSGPSGPESDISFLNYAAHEIGHMLDRGHPNTGTACGHNASDPTYPYPDANIAKADTPAKEFAFLDLPDGAIGLTYYDRDDAFDVMGYCEPNRISDHNFEGIYQFALSAPLAAASAAGGGPVGPAGGPPIPGDWLFLSGVLDTTAGTGDVVLARRVPEVADATAPTPSGLATLELRDAASNLLASHGLPGSPIEELPGRYAWDLVVPFAPGTSELRIVDDATSAVLATRGVSANAPVVSNVDLPGAPDPVDGIVTTTWLASDADGDSLEFDLLASRDAGVTFRTIVAGITGTSFDLDSSLLAGGSTILRIQASDGLLTGSADSAPIVVAPRAPKPMILSPEDGHRADWDQLVTLEGDASDLQDEIIAESGFVWSNAYGVIGTGRIVQTSSLQLGVNAVTLTVTNSLGESAAATIDVIIGDPLTDPSAAIAASPQTFSWHVANDETASQQAILSVDNAGGGALGFDIASDQPWLLIDGATAHSGVSAPATFTISVDPSVLPPGQASDGILSIQSLADPFDVVTVPVSLAKGNVFDHTGDLDSDLDSVADIVDNCPSFANPSQSDSGGIGAASGPDGIGDACQCGDVNGNGRVTTADATLVTRSLLVPPTAVLAEPQQCNVGGSAACTTADAVIITRALLVPPTAAVQQVCAPAL